MTNHASGLYGRSALERLLGAGWFYFTDSSGSGPQGHLRFACGCTALESQPDRFHVLACDGHRDLMQQPAEPA